jgi:4-hydroxybenzoate polyprenyltransferase
MVNLKGYITDKNTIFTHFMTTAGNYFRLIRVKDWAGGYFFLPLVGSIASTGISPALIWTAVVSMCLLAFCFVINNMADTEIDRFHGGKCQSNKNPLATNDVTISGTWFLMAFFAIVPLAISLGSGALPFVFVICALFLFTAYSVRPFRLKERYLVDLATHGIMMGGLLFVIGYFLPSAEVSLISPDCLALTALFTCIGCMALVVHQIGDYHEDFGHTPTSVVRMGKPWGWRVFVFFFILSLICLAMVHLIISLALWVLFGSASLFAIPLFLLRDEIMHDFFSA